MSDYPTDRPILVADWWYCGDEYCRCSYPQIRRLIPPVREIVKDGRVVAKHWQGEGSGEVERGPWISEPDTAERREQWAWLLDAARRHQVVNLAEIEEEAKEN